MSSFLPKQSQQLKLSPLSYAILLSFSSFTTMTYAAESEQETNKLPTITLQAQGNWLEEADAEKVHNYAGARTIIDRKRLNETAVTSIREALKQVPGVQAQESNGTGGSDVSLNIGVRGLASRLSPRSTVLLDGIPLSFAPYGQPQLSLAPVSIGNIESIDVVRGAGAVRFGPQNVGGIINFSTRAIPQEFSGSIGVTTEFATHSDQLKYSPNLFLGGTLENGLGLALLYSGTKGNGFREHNNKVNIDDVMLKSKYSLTDQDEVSLNLHHYDGRGDMPEGLTEAQYAQNPFQSTHEKDYFSGRRTDVSFRYNHKDDENNFELLGYYIDSFRTSNLETVLASGKKRLDSAPRSYKVYAIEPRYSRAYEFNDIQSEVTVGYRFLKENSSEVAGRTDNYGANDPALPFSPRSSSEGGTKAHAVYIDNRIELGRWTVTPGVRFESISTHNQFTGYDSKTGLTNTVHPKIDSSEYLPSLSVMYSVNDQWNLFANAGVSFGPQQYSQLARLEGVIATATTDGLHPEKSKNYEIGTKYLGHGLNAEFTVFYLDFDKELSLIRDASNNGIWTDLGATSHKGIETGLNYDFGQLLDALEGLKAYGNYTFTKAVAKAGKFKDMDLPFYSRHVANVGVGYTIENWTLNADMFAQSKQRSPNIPNSDVYQTIGTPDGKYGDMPGYSTYAVRVAYDFNSHVKGLKIAGGIKNLLDKQYFTRSTDSTGGKYVGQPRTFYLQTSFDF